MKQIKVKINDKTYTVDLAVEEKDLEEGLQNKPKLDDDKGMLFIFEDDEEPTMWMKDTHIPLDIIFIDEDWEVIKVIEGEPLSEQLITVSDAKFVLELNRGSGVVVGDYVDLDEIELEEKLSDEDKEIVLMLVLDEQGNSQMDLEGGERIFSRPNTKTLIRMARRAAKSELDKDYKALGRKVFAYLKKQDSNPEDTVDIPD